MNTRTPWSDEQIHAHVDGELDAESAARLEADCSVDPALAARIARQRQLRDRLRAGFSTVLQEPVPQRLQDALASAESRGNVLSLDAGRTARSPRRRWALREWGAIAAALVLGTLLGPQLFRSATPVPFESRQGGITASGYLDAALSRQAGGTTREATIGLTFRAQGGEYCRTFGLQTGSTGLACLRNGRWTIELLEGGGVTASAPEYRTAGSEFTPAMLEAIARLGADAALTPEEERRALDSRWNGAADMP